MLPSPWVGLVLALAVYRLCRLVGWDDFPPVVRVRAWATGCEVVTIGSHNARQGLTGEQVERSFRYRRATLAHFLSCPFCFGFWAGVCVYVAWLYEPTWVLYGAAPFALSGAVGIISKQLDP